MVLKFCFDGGNTVCGVHTEVGRELNPAVFQLKQGVLRSLMSNMMTRRATVDESTADLGQTPRTGRLVVGVLSFNGVSGLRMSSRAHGLPGGTQVPGVKNCRPLQALVSCSGSRTTACDPDALPWRSVWRAAWFQPQALRDADVKI